MVGLDIAALITAIGGLLGALGKWGYDRSRQKTSPIEVAAGVTITLANALETVVAPLNSQVAALSVEVANLRDVNARLERRVRTLSGLLERNGIAVPDDD